MSAGLFSDTVEVETVHFLTLSNCKIMSPWFINRRMNLYISQVSKSQNTILGQISLLIISQIELEMKAAGTVQRQNIK